MSRPICYTYTQKIKLVLYQPRRNKAKFHWTNIEKRNFPRFKALKHFDDFYKSIYGDNLWRSLRLGLLCNNKYCAVVNNYSDSDKTIQELESRGALNMRRLYEMQLVKLIAEDKLSRPDTSDDSVSRLERKIESIIEETAKRDKLSSMFGHYEKVEAGELEKIEEMKKNNQEVVLEPVEVSTGKLSLTEGLKDAYLDHSRIIHPKKSISYATLHEFIPATKIKGMDTWISEAEHYEFYKKSLDFPINVELEENFTFPRHLHVYTYEKSNVTSFPHPKEGPTGVLDFYLLDGGSIVPILALSLEKGDRLLDMCGAPGGKAITAMQTLMPNEVVCNDLTLSRVNRIKKVASEYLYNTSGMNKFLISQVDGLKIEKRNYYNKILVDVPCTNDRVSVTTDENNYFSTGRMAERVRLPEKQSDLLAAALRLVSNGGCVVYSTCSLSPIQNDGVVQMALKKTWNETNTEFVVKNLQEAFKPLNVIYHLGTKVGMKYGIVILPHLTANFGPMYVCKLERVK